MGHDRLRNRGSISGKRLYQVMIQERCSSRRLFSFSPSRKRKDNPPLECYRSFQIIREKSGENFPIYQRICYNQSMPDQIPFSIVRDACKETGATVVLIGGQALASRGYQRLTLDVNFMITEKDYEKLKPAIFSKGYREVIKTNVAAKWQCQSSDLIDIDFMFVDVDTFETIKKAAKLEDYEESQFLVPKAEHLIALKLHAIKQQPKKRELKDLNDIMQLVKANNMDIQSQSFQNLCKQFGTAEL